jgi:hypothetical protein
MKGEIEVGAVGVSGPYQVWAKAPNKQVSKLEFGGFGTISEGYDGAVAWAEAPGLGARVKTGGELSRVQRSTSFPRELHIKQAYARLEARGRARWGTSMSGSSRRSSKEGKPDRLFRRPGRPVSGPGGIHRRNARQEMTFRSTSPITARWRQGAVLDQGPCRPRWLFRSSSPK